MANDIMTVVYVHAHRCEREGQRVEIRPTCRDGAAQLPRVECIETGAELEIVERRKV